MKLIKFEIVTPERMVMQEMVQQIVAPTKAGEITVLPGHIPIVASLQAGVIETKNEKGENSVMSVSGGFIEVLSDKVVILADTAERAEELDETRIEEARTRAEEAKKDIRSFDRERFASINAKMAKELARSKAAKRWRKLKGN
ncbi:MAG: ATP synthase F1 subunit epsilon [Patescibacteria group bacterium]|jgi:F-type H+-transporting ATPase subunit epsilon|nr:ATP synthase F1 subunit epsilon [Patescibacteria group bacterium]